MQCKLFRCAVCKKGSQHWKASSFRYSLFSTTSGGEGCINSDITNKKQKKKHRAPKSPCKGHCSQAEGWNKKAERRPLLGTCVSGTQSFAALLTFVHDLKEAARTALGLQIILTSRWITEGK